MRLAEAIRIGATKRPQQARVFYFDGVGTCTLGAAYEGATGLSADCNDDSDVNMYALVELFPELNQFACVCPVCGVTRHNLYRTIEHLNDDELWTREAIADFIDSLGTVQA